MLRPFDVETPGRWSGAGAGEAGVEGGIDVRQSSAHGRIGRGFQAYELAKRNLPPMTPAEFQAACRRIADLAGV
jgi:hypothetical protein